MIQSGRFSTDTKTKIKTKYGTILKVTIYDGDPESYPDIEYKIRPVCEYCGKTTECLCFNSYNCDFPYEDALYSIQKQWICNSDTCLIKYEKENDPEHYNELHTRYNGNKKAIAESISDILNTIEEGEYCYV